MCPPVITKVYSYRAERERFSSCAYMHVEIRTCGRNFLSHNFIKPHLNSRGLPKVICLALVDLRMCTERGMFSSSAATSHVSTVQSENRSKVSTAKKTSHHSDAYDVAYDNAYDDAYDDA